ncbi:hypothetical protein HDU99_009946 [Rhizoclosmatium hyalinum]|nr:hypothetical protein HDU99_009946 [Rhizoclosmatium hyalinum]
MRLFAEQEAFGPQPEHPVNQISSNARVTTSSSFVSDETSVQQVMDLFKQQESELKGSSSTLKEAIDVTPSFATVVEERQALLVNLVDPSNGPTYLLHNWKSLIPSYLVTHVPDAISLLENAHLCEIEELKSQLHGLERRLGKLADTGLGAEKKTAVEIVHRALEEVLGMRKSMALAEALQREAEEEAEVVENVANDYEVTQVEEAEKVVRIRSPSPTPSDAGSDHSAHSLQERIRKMENGDIEEPEDENLVYEDAEDLTDIPQASEHEDREFLEFLAKSREMDRSGLQNDVQANIDKLMSQNRKEKRDSATISSDMIRECQV